jgi:hypothetical protein
VDTKDELGFTIDKLAIANARLECGASQQGHIKTYFVDCRLSADIEHPAMFAPNGKVISISRWLPIDKLGSEDLANLKKAGLVPKGRADPDIPGTTYSIVLETIVTPTFVLQGGKQDSKLVQTKVDATFKRTVSDLKCEIFRVGKSSFYYCFDFGSK